MSETPISPGAGLRRRSIPQSHEPHRSAPTHAKPTRSRTAFFFALSITGLVLILSRLETFFLDRLHRFSLHIPNPTTPSPLSRVPSAGSLDHLLNPDRHNARRPKTHHHNWRVTKDLRSPDGVKKHVYLINDAFPGPTLEMRSGDRLVIEVENAIGDGEGLSIHWHGLFMRGANRMDGAVGFTQHPILPGANFTYEFDIADDQAGSFWYHAHNQVQRADGLFGGLVVHRPSITGSPVDSQKYEYDEERLLLIGDWYHRSAQEVLAWYMRAGSFGNEPVPDSLLVNGLGAYNCSKAVPARPVECVQHRGTAVPNLHFDRAQRYRLRLVNTGTLAGFTVSITGATLRAIEVDGGNLVSSIVATAASVGILHPGQRTDLILSWSSNVGAEPKLTVTLDGEDFKYPNPALTRTQYFPVTFTNSTTAPSTTPPARPGDEQRQTRQSTPNHIDLSTLTAAEPITPPLSPNTTHTLLLYANTLKLSHRGNVPHGYMNQTSWSPQSSPPGLLTDLPRTAWDANQFVPHIPAAHRQAGGSANPDPQPHAADAHWVTVILHNLDDGAHPFHLHGHSVRVLQTHVAGWGWGSWNPCAEGEAPGGGFELERAVARDTVMVPRRGYVVLRFEADNEGVWMLHCHNLWHQASGMAMGIEVGGDDGTAVQS